MLKIKIKTADLYDEIKNEFIDPIDTELLLEHSLVSISKWEAIYKKAFFNWRR